MAATATVKERSLGDARSAYLPERPRCSLAVHISEGVAGRIHLGTSGYVYQHWRGFLYPDRLPASQWLSMYASIFTTLELNATFYRLPTAQAAAGWRAQTPEGFRFVAKGSRFLTHMKRLTDTGVGLERFFTPLRALGDKLDAVLWQLPPQMSRPDVDKLDRFLSALPTHVRHAFEFRHVGWYTREVAEVLDRHGVAFCEHDLVDAPIPRPTGGFRYLRFHGRLGYRGLYGRKRLAPFARSLEAWRARGRDAYVYFNNDLEGHALLDAFELSELLGAELPFLLDAPTVR
jgi:uncharacterized protein YecE (DUF72 family)